MNNITEKAENLFGVMRHSTEEENRCYEEMLNKLGHELVEIPTRCKDCEHYWEGCCMRNSEWRTFYEPGGGCGENLEGMVGVEPDGFCSWGKRKENSDLPTAEEYAELASEYFAHNGETWSKPRYQCPKCGGGMCKNLEVALSTYPMQYMYKCDKCGYVENQYV